MTASPNPNKVNCEGAGNPGSPVPCNNGGTGCCKYFDPTKGCLYSLLGDDWTTAASEQRWGDIIPVTHPGNYLLAVGYYAAWLIVQAILSLFGALLSCCCMNKKKLEDDEEAPPFSVMMAAKGVLAILLLGTIFMANSMELLGNRALNGSMHNGIHAVEGVFAYVDAWLAIGHSALDVGDNVYVAVEAVNQTIFGNANPAMLAEASTCLQSISTACEVEHPDGYPYDTILSDNYVWAGDGGGPQGSPMSQGKCETTSYTADVEGAPGSTADTGTDWPGTGDYVLGSGIDSANVLLNAFADTQGECIMFCMMALPGCTGAQWSLNTTTNEETNCVLWLNDKCSTGSAAPGYVAGTNPPDPALPTELVYKRTATTVRAEQLDCINVKTIPTLAGINDNVLSLPSAITDITLIMDNMMTNQITLCMIPIAGPLGDGLSSLASTLSNLQDTLATLMATMRGAIRDGRVSLNQMDDSYEQLVAPPPPGDFATSFDANGDPYPQDTIIEPAKPAECRGGLSCVLEPDESDCQPSNQESCYFMPRKAEGTPQLVDHTCASLQCIDNTLDYMDENRGGDLPMARTQLFTYVSLAATGGSLLGLLALGTNKTIFWKLMCLLFFFWGPFSLILSGLVHPAMIIASDTCQDMEEVAIDVALAQNPRWAAEGTITLMEGSDIEASVRALPNFNYTGDPIGDIAVDDMRGLMGFYLTDDCQGAGGGSIASTLALLNTIMNDVVVVMAGNAGEMVDSMSSSMGAGVAINADLILQIQAITTIVSTQVPPVIDSAFNMVGCRELSATYYTVKSPICCDIVVSMYWVAYPLSVMVRPPLSISAAGSVLDRSCAADPVSLLCLCAVFRAQGFCTLAAMILTMFIGSKAFPGVVPENPKKAGGGGGDDVESTDNPSFGK